VFLHNQMFSHNHMYTLHAIVVVGAIKRARARVCVVVF